MLSVGLRSAVGPNVLGGLYMLHTLRRPPASRISIFSSLYGGDAMCYAEGLIQTVVGTQASLCCHSPALFCCDMVINAVSYVGD